MTSVVFPEDFLWGVATAAYQIEGACREDGKSESIWDRFAHTPGKINDDSNGDISCDHYHLYREDVALMRDLNIKAYRFSVSWPRILPQGSGKVNRAGIDFYSRLVDELLSYGIQPLVTLYHWDLPQILDDRGGWANRDIAGRFGEYAAVVAGALGDRVGMWTTLNEPSMFSFLGYLIGIHAPGHQDPVEYFNVAHNINLAHGQAVIGIRSEIAGTKVGTVLQIPPVHPSSDSEEDQRAAKIIDSLLNGWWIEPVLLGRYPEDILELMSQMNLSIDKDDLDKIYQPLDFVGLNLYTRLFAFHDENSQFLKAGLDPYHHIPDARYTDIGWEVYPEAIYETLIRFKNEWGDPDVYITENGSAEKDQLLDGMINDQLRIDYLKGYLSQVRRAMDYGVKVKGYFVRTLMDNFEWQEGYTKRFGIVYVDHSSLKRIPKASALWYRDLINSGRYEMD